MNDARYDPHYVEPEPTAAEKSLNDIADSARRLLEIEVLQRNLDSRIENLFWAVEKMSHDVKMIEHHTRLVWWTMFPVSLAAIVYLYRSFA